MRDYISVDLETTGFSPETCDIIEIGAWKVKEGVVVDKFLTLVRPIMYIPRTVQEMTGITMDDVADCQTIEPTIVEFHDWCEGMPFLGHNLPFDYKFLCFKGKYAGVDFSAGGTRQGIDTLALSRQYLNLPGNKLQDVAEYFNIHVEAAQGSMGYHRAGYDSYITKLVYDHFLYGYPNILPISTPTKLDDKDGKYGKPVIMDTLDF